MNLNIFCYLGKHDIYLILEMKALENFLCNNALIILYFAFLFSFSHCFLVVLKVD